MSIEGLSEALTVTVLGFDSIFMYLRLEVSEISRFCFLAQKIFLFCKSKFWKGKICNQTL